MTIVVVPNSLRDAIYEKVDKALAGYPQLADKREEIYNHMLAHYDETGSLPDFRIEPAQSRDDTEEKK